MTVRIYSTRIRRIPGRMLRRDHFFLAVAFLALGYCGSAFARAPGYRSAEIPKLQSTIVSAVSGPLVDGGVIGEIMVPRLGLKVILAEGISDDVLKHAAGHMPETPLPGQWGNVAVAAHRNTFFRPLRNIRIGDVIVVKTADASFLYQVESTIIVEPTDVQVLEASGPHTLTLITCFPFNYVGLAPHRFIVRARELRALGEDVSTHETFSRELQITSSK